MRRSLRVFGIGAALALLVGLGGCGSDGGAAVDTGGAGGPDVAAPADVADAGGGALPDAVPDTGGAPDGGPGVDATPDVSTDAPAAADIAVPLIWSGRVLNIAHRGGGLRAPEHTMVAYEGAIAAGADMLELDVHSTSDGVLVISHDDTVDRVTDGVGQIHDRTLAELRTLDAGYRYTEDGGATFPWRGQGLTMVTLEEVLVAFPDVWLNVEPKQVDPPIVAPLLDLLAAHGVLDHCVVGAFESVKLEEVRQLRPDVATGFGTEEILAFLALTPATEADYVPPGEVLQVPHAGVTPDLLARARRFGLVVHPWTVNDRARMEALLDLGVDGIMTDDPVLLQSVLEARGLR